MNHGQPSSRPSSEIITAELDRGRRVAGYLAPYRPARAQTVIDVGCGNGIKASSYHAGLTIIGFEGEHRHACEAAHWLPFVMCLDWPLAAAGIPDKAADWVTFIDSLEHLPEEQGRFAVSEAQRIARMAVTVYTPEGDVSAWRKESEREGRDRHRVVFDISLLSSYGLRVTVLPNVLGPRRNFLMGHWETT